MMKTKRRTFRTIISFALALVMLLPLMTAPRTYAADAPGLAGAIALAKQHFGDTDDYRSFDYEEYSYSNSGELIIYMLGWSDSETGRPDMEVSIGSNGRVYEYSIRVSSSGSSIVVPEITKERALEIAHDFTIKLNPDYEGCISRDHATVSYSKYGVFRITFYRYENDLRVENNNISVTVAQDGTVRSYSENNMQNGSPVMQEGGFISNAELIEAAKEKLPMQLIYRTFYANEEGQNDSVRLIYTLNSDYTHTAINPFDGSTIELVSSTSDKNYAAEVAEGSSNLTMSATDSAAPTFSAAEQSAIDFKEGMISLDDAVELLDAAGLKLTDGMRVYTSRLYEEKSGFTGDSRYFWRITFRSADENGGYSGSARAVIDAVSGEIISFSDYTRATKYQESPLFAYSEEECYDAADSFISEYYKEKSEEYRLTTTLGQYDADTKLSVYSFRYVRVVNGIDYSDDYIYISIDPDTLDVTSLTFDYCDATFPEVKSIIDVNRAADRYFAVIPPEIFCISGSELRDGTLYKSYSGPYWRSEQVIFVPVYMFTNVCYIDAFTGELINGAGKSYEYRGRSYFTPSPFTDIEDSPYREQIEALANMDVIKAGDRYNPRRNISQGDFFEMLKYFNSSAYYRYLEAVELHGSEQTSEKSFSIEPERAVKSAAISREDAIKVIIDAMELTTVAKLEGIYVDVITDADQLSSGMSGYIAIAKGLGLIDDLIAEDGSFAPQSKLSRGEAAALICNYINVLNSNS